jgi:SAM domain (Sterile alpha motif)
MHQKLAAALDKLPFEIPAKRLMMNPPKSPSQRNSRQLDPSTIQAMFPDAAAALAHKRSLLSSNRNSMNGLPTTTTPLISSEPRSPGMTPASKDKDGWPISSSIESPISLSKRPASADLTGWQQGGTPITNAPKSPGMKAANTPTVDNLTSPFGIPGGASWASLVNTPVVPMFQNPYTTSVRGDTDLAGSTAMKLAAWNANRSSVSGGVINLDDVRKFRRGRSQTPANNEHSVPSIPQSTRDISPNIVMYDENGQVLLNPHISQAQLNQLNQLNQLRAVQALGTPTATTNTSRSRPTSPYPPPFPTFPSIRVSSPVMNTTPYYPTFDASPIMPPSEFTQGYLSDHTPDRRGSPLGVNARPRNYSSTRRSSSTTKHQEDPLDPNLLTDIPGWLRSLRLHKYTENLADVKGGVMGLSNLTDEDLEKRGVSAVGARRKLLKCFEQVKGGTSGINSEAQ